MVPILFTGATLSQITIACSGSQNSYRARNPCRMIAVRAPNDFAAATHYKIPMGRSWLWRPLMAFCGNFEEIWSMDFLRIAALSLDCCSQSLFSLFHLLFVTFLASVLQSLARYKSLRWYRVLYSVRFSPSPWQKTQEKLKLGHVIGCVASPPLLAPMAHIIVTCPPETTSLTLKISRGRTKRFPFPFPFPLRYNNLSTSRFPHYVQLHTQSASLP